VALLTQGPLRAPEPLPAPSGAARRGGAGCTCSSANSVFAGIRGKLGRLPGSGPLGSA
ncbi:hypothetical protein AK812_SmicGene47588, partial [Symbiodinium microadriaticum]